MTKENNETCPHEAARNLKAMIDVLQMASTTDGMLDDTLEDYAGSMLEKVNVICTWFNGGGAERIMSADAEPTATGNDAAAKGLEETLTALQRIASMAAILGGCHRADMTGSEHDFDNALWTYAETIEGLLEPTFGAVQNGIEALQAGAA